MLAYCDWIDLTHQKERADELPVQVAQVEVLFVIGEPVALVDLEHR